jgi:hypothetical protein
MGSLLNDREKFFFDSRNIEVLKLAGAENSVLWSKSVNPYQLSQDLFGSAASGISGMDCLYGESNPIISGTVDGKQHGYFKYYDVLALFEEPSITFDVTVLGAEEVADAIIWMSRKDLDNHKVPRDTGGDYVKAGDIVQLFSKDKKETMYYSVINANRTGYVNDSKTFTQYKLDCVRSTSFVPERLIP